MSAGAVSPTQWFAATAVDELSRRLDDPPQVRAQRARAFHAFETLPSEQDPLYKKYAHLAGIDLRAVDPAKGGAPVAMPSPGPSEVLVLHDASGTRITLPPALASAGVRALSLPEIWKADGALSGTFTGDLERLHGERFGAMNAALVNRGLYVDLPDALPSPVRVREISVLSEASQALVVHRLIRAGSRTHLFHSEEVYSTHADPAPRLYSSSTSVVSGADSTAVLLGAQGAAGGVVGFFDRYAEVGPTSSVTWLFAGMDGWRTSLRNRSLLKHRGGELSDYEVFLGEGAQSVTSQIHVLHEADDTRGQSFTRGVFKDDSRGTIKGMMRIEPHVRKVFSNLSEHALLLSRRAKADTLPGMEILSAADVKATHSSSVAPLDPERIFYVQSRGLDTEAATRLITEGFLANILLKAPIAGLETTLSRVLDARWGGRALGWDGQGAYGSLTPTSANWRTAEEVRMDTKLR